MTSGPGSIAIWAIALMIAAIIGFWFVLWIRRRMLDAGESGGAGLTLAELRSLHASGELTDEEYEAARRAILGAATRGSAPERPGSVETGFRVEADPGVDLTGDPLPRPRDAE